MTAAEIDPSVAYKSQSPDTTVRETGAAARSWEEGERQDHSHSERSGEPGLVKSTASMTSDADRGSSDWMSLSELRKGAADKLGNKVLEIYLALPNFKIYRTEQGVFIHFSDNSEILTEQLGRYLKPQKVLSEIRGLLKKADNSKFVLRKDADKQFYEIAIARAIAASVLGYPDDASDAMRSTHESLLSLQQSAARLQYLLSCLCTFIVISVIFGLITMSGRVGTIYPLSIVAGSAGAFLSITLNVSDMNINPLEPMTLHNVMGFLRIIFGSMAGYVLVVAVQAKIFGSFFAHDNGIIPTETIIFLSILAGFAERLVPNLLLQQAQTVSARPGRVEAPSDWRADRSR
jgi:hypothetical protein